MPSVAELATIRKLSQYRPFERGGRDALEAQEDLLIAALAEAGGSLDGVQACRDAISAFFNLDYDEVEVARALKPLLEDGHVERRGTSFALSQAEFDRMEAVAQESAAIADLAIAEWLGSVAERFPGLSEDDDACLREDLEHYLRVVIQRHGAEATLLLYPDDPVAQRLYDDLEKLGFNFLAERPGRLDHIRRFALSNFMRHPTEAQSLFLSQNLNTGYFWTVLSIDPDGARLIQDLAAGQRVYLDTNFIFRLLGIQGPRYVRPAEVLLERTQSAGYEACVTPWTIDELKRRVHASRDFLKQYPVPPSDYAALAADATSDDDFVTLYWRRVRDEPGLRVDDFLGYFDEVSEHLAARGIPARDEGCTAVDARHIDIADEVVILERVTIGGRERPLRTLQHDVKHRLLIERRRGDANRTFATAGAWFLTYDSVLPRYDNLARQGTSELPFCVTAASWFQVAEAFNPKSGDLARALGDLLASPYVRYRRTLSKESAQAIVARTNLHSDGTPELAARVFMNTAALEDIEQSVGSEEQLEKIDNALLAAAREVQEEARLAAAEAHAARDRAAEAERAAAERVREAELEQEAVVERERGLRDEAVRNAAARADEAAKNEAARVAAERRATAAAHEGQLAAANRKIARQAAIARRTRRRQRLATLFIVALVVFIGVALAAGVAAAWAYLVGAGALISVGVGMDHVASRSEDIPPANDSEPAGQLPPDGRPPADA